MRQVMGAVRRTGREILLACSIVGRRRGALDYAVMRPAGKQACKHRRTVWGHRSGCFGGLIDGKETPLKAPWAPWIDSASLFI